MFSNEVAKKMNQKILDCAGIVLGDENLVRGKKNCRLSKLKKEKHSEGLWKEDVMKKVIEEMSSKNERSKGEKKKRKEKSSKAKKKDEKKMWKIFGNKILPSMSHANLSGEKKKSKAAESWKK